MMTTASKRWPFPPIFPVKAADDDEEEDLTQTTDMISTMNSEISSEMITTTESYKIIQKTWPTIGYPKTPSAPPDYLVYLR